MNIGLFLEKNIEAHSSYANDIATALDKELMVLHDLSEVGEDYAEENAIDLYILSISNDRRKIRKALEACRDLRVPYIFLTPNMSAIRQPQKVLLPVTMLEEEIYKIEIAVHLCRHTNASAQILTAHDYGSKARHISQKMFTYTEKMRVESEALDAYKDSFHLYKEVIDRQRELHSDMVIWTASREYGLDDILFGPPEQHLIQRMTIPCMLVNPREDLFSLCD